MYIKKIELLNFRNYKKNLIEFDKNINLILGNNAQGKTNLIEAIYILAVGKSFRTSKDFEIINFDSEFSSIKINYFKDNEENELEVILRKNQKKSAKLNGVDLKKISELLKNIFVVIFSPEDLKIVKEDPEKRRKFIDIELCKLKPSYYSNLANYKKILLQRNAYLKEENIDANVLNIWDEKLTEYGSKIIKQREEFINKINNISEKIHNEITEGKEKLKINYSSNIKIENNLELQEKTFSKLLSVNYKNDLKQKTTTVGPHKDDIQFFINDMNVKKYGSQGQQRTVALSVKLAELNLIKEETGFDAVLLLDDVMSELDQNRQEYLIKTFKNNQLFITTTDISDELVNKFGKKKIFFVENGQIKERKE